VIAGNALHRIAIHRSSATGPSGMVKLQPFADRNEGNADHNSEKPQTGPMLPKKLTLRMLSQGHKCKAIEGHSSSSMAVPGKAGGSAADKHLEHCKAQQPHKPTKGAGNRAGCTPKFTGQPGR
jgi:hypothetical protein